MNEENVTITRQTIRRLWIAVWFGMLSTGVLKADTFGLFTYVVSGNSITITDYPTDATGVVEVPASIVGKPVTQIGDEAFSGCLELTNIVLPASVTEVGRSAFNGCATLSGINLPPMVSSIGSQAFYGCSMLAGMTFPAGLSSIGSQAFQGCSSLTGIVLPSRLTSVGASAFFGCSALTSVVIPSSLTSIPSNLFYDCGSLAEVTIPASVTSIADLAFANCPSLVRANFLGNAPSLGGSVFNSVSPTFAIHHISGKTGFSSIGWPATDDLSSPVMLVVQPVGTNFINSRTKTFGNVAVGSSSVLTFTIQNSGNLDLTDLTVTKDGNHSTEFEILTPPVAPVAGGNSTSFTVRFSPAGTGGRSAAIHIANNDPTGNPFHIKLTGTGTMTGSDGQFAYLDNGLAIMITGLAAPASGELIIPSSIMGRPVTAIGDNAFRDSGELTAVVIPSSVTSIGSYAFADCSGLTTVSIPASVNTIGTFAFHQCGNLASANFQGNAPVLGSSAFLGAASGFAIHFITGKTGFTTPTWRGYPCTDASISLNRLHGPALANGSTFNFGETVVGFGFMQTFTITNSGTAVMTGIAVSVAGANPADFTVTTAPSSTAGGYGGTTNFTIRFRPVAEGPRNAELRIQSSDSTASPFLIRLEGAGSVTGTYGIFTYVDEGASISIVGHTPNPSGAAVIPAAIIGKPVTSIWSKAFENCSGLTSVSIPSTVSILGSSAFSGCSGLASLVIPPTVSQIGKSSFSGCTGLKTLSLPAGLYYLGDSAFAGCTGLSELVIPAGINLFGESVFAGCTGLADVTLSNGVLKLGRSAFEGCTSLVRIDIPSGMTYLGSSVFSGCTGLAEVSFPEGLTEIGAYAFAGCTGLFRLNLPSTVTDLWGWAFSGCSSLTHIIIPAAVTYIGPGVFENCSALTSVCFNGNAPSMTPDAYNGLPSEFVSYFFNDATGFTSPIWMGRPSVNMGDGSPVKPWLLENGLPYDADLKSDPNRDGVDLLTAYALGLDPNQNLAGRLPMPSIQGNEMKLTFHGNSQGVAYAVEHSVDLNSWTSAGITLSPPDAGGLRTATLDVAGSSRFMRIVFVH